MVKLSDYTIPRELRIIINDVLGRIYKGDYSPPDEYLSNCWENIEYGKKLLSIPTIGLNSDDITEHMTYMDLLLLIKENEKDIIAELETLSKFKVVD